MSKKADNRSVSKSKRFLILLVSAVVAVAIGLTCGLCFGTNSGSVGTTSGIDGGNASHSAAAPSTSEAKDYTTTGAIKNDDVLNFPFVSDGIYEIKLPKGTYKAEVWGAQGGSGDKSTSTRAGANGGYAVGALVLNEVKTLYVVVGGTPTSAWLGGYNGGGASQNVSSTHDTATSGRAWAGGGGGATHISSEKGTLKDIGESKKTSVYIVAGGGGGAGRYDSSAAGVGGGTTGGDSVRKGAGGGCGGTQSAGGERGYPNQTGSGTNQHQGYDGSFGKGGDAYYNNASSNPYISGGGGGGWYGGGSGGTSGTYGGLPGGGGSSYIGGVTTTTANNITITKNTIAGDATQTKPAGGTEIGHSGSGYARITAIQVNQAPVQQEYAAIENQPIGSITTKTIKSYELGTDDDYSNQSGATKNSVYYVNGKTTTDLTSGSEGLYLDEDCTISATPYINYSFGSDGQTLSITGFKQQPRKEASGVSKDNELTVYVGMRDTYGGSSTTYAYGVYHFDISFATITATHQTDTTGNKKSGNYVYRYGLASGTDSSVAASGGLFSPKGKDTWTLCVQQPIQKTQSVTINAADLLKISAPSGTNTSLFKAVLVPSAAVSGLFSYSGSTVTFNSTVTGYTSLTITANGSSPDWQNITFTLYMVENTTCTGAKNIEPVGITYTKKVLDVNFRVDNTRPTLRAYNNVVDVPVGGSVDVSLNTYFQDIDGAITKDSHSILGIEVPQYEFVQLDKYNNIVSTKGMGGTTTNVSYYNVAGGSLSDTPLSGKSTVPTGFNANIATTVTNSEAFLLYTKTANDVITLKGLRPSYSQYNRTATTAYTDGKNTAPTSSGTVSNPGHFYLLIHIRDNNDTADNGIWLPIAIRVGYAQGLTPVTTGSSTGSVSNQGKLSDMPRAVGNVNDTFYFVPMGINIGNTEYPIGKILDESGNEFESGVGANHVQALALDGDNFTTNTGLSSWSGKLNEHLYISSFPTKVSDNSRKVDYAKIEKVNVYIPTSYFGGRVKAGDAYSRDTATGVNTVKLATDAQHPGYYVVDGLKITLLSATMNRYFYVNVGVNDSYQNAVTGGVNIAINVSNADPERIAEANIAKYNEANAFKYDYNGTITLSYKVPMRSTFFITPYDLVSDINMLDGGAVYPTGGFTLNGLSGKYVAGKFTTGVEASASEQAVKALYDTNTYGSPGYITQLKSMLDNINNQKQTVAQVATGYAFNSSGTATGVRDTAVLNDRLYFVRTSDTTSDAYTFNPNSTDFIYNVTNVADYVDIFAGNQIAFGSDTYNVDYLMFKAVTRTAADAEISLTVRDRYGAVAIPIKIKIAIINTSPKLVKVDVPELAVTAVENGATIINPTSLTVTPDEVMTDSDGDKLVYVPSRGILVARGKTISGIETLVDLGTENNHPEYSALLSDAYGNSLTDHYLTAVMNSSGEFTVTALGSTKNIEEGVYVYFFVTDGRGGTTLGYMPVEVLNTSPTFNTRESDGFASEDRLWSLESARDADITRSRYIVGSENARAQLKDKATATDSSILLAAADADIKLIATDVDALHSEHGVILSQRRALPTSYVNHGIDIDYDASVPRISTENQGFDVYPAAVAVSTAYDNGTFAAMPDIVNAQLLFFVKGEWYEREDLITELKKSSGGAVVHDDVFDGNRWAVNDWALRITTTDAFRGYKLRITFSVRDDMRYGGDTAGDETAYNSDRTTDLRESVEGYLEVPDVFMYISGTGIRTKDDFNVYNNNYVVEYEKTSPKTSVSYLVKKVGDAVSASTYSAGAENEEGKFEYLSTITVPANQNGTKSYQTVYVPMSYFGQQKAIVAPSHDHVVEYKNTFVGYDVRTSEANVNYSISSISGISSAISLYDGNTTWGGNTGKPLSDNPYINIAAVDYTGSMNGASYFSNEVSKYYYNTQLSVSTADLDYSNVSDDEYIPGTNKQLIYLKEQTTKLREHNFGLSFTKKNMRTGSFNLQLTVNLALSEVVRDDSGNITGIKTACESAGDARSVTVSIRVENSPVDFVTGKSDSALKFDDTYYVDISMSTSSSDVYALVRDNSNESSGGRKKIYYTDSDIDTSAAAYRDMVYFSLDSINGMTAAGNTRPSKSNNNVFANVSTATVSDNNRAQMSMLGYYGVDDADDAQTGGYIANAGKYSYSSYFNVTMSENGKVLNIKSSRKTTINESVLPEIVENEFSEFGDWDDDYVYGGLTYEQLSDIYASRGLRIVYYGVNKEDYGNVIPDTMTMRAYYPLKVLVYDTCGAGWDDASYVSMEFRITILNTTPTINTDNLTYNSDKKRYEKTTKLAVGSTMYLDLDKYVYDPDILTIDSQLATIDQFNAEATGVDRETGDYLESLFSYNFKRYSDDEEAAAQAAQSDLLRGRAGLSVQGYDGADVIMYMEVEGNVIDEHSVPATNRLWFRVNRRTSDDDGNIKDTFEFTMAFRDNHYAKDNNSVTAPITFIVEIDNQAPTITTRVTKVTMHSGDRFVLLPAYYDTFIGGKNYVQDNKTFEPGNILPREGSPAYLKSLTYKEYYSGRLHNGANSWNYYDMTTENCQDAFKTDTSNGSGKEHLGYLGIATDDAPWRLRFEPNAYSDQYVRVTRQNNVLPELKDGVGQDQYPMALLIEAKNACTQHPVTFYLTDGEGGSVSYTIEFTIVSAPPRALNPNTDEIDKLKLSNLDGVDDPDYIDGGDKYLNNGTFSTFIIPSGGVKGVEVEIDGFGKKKAYGQTHISLNHVATDPDDSSAALTLHGNGYFKVNNQSLSVVNGQYVISGSTNYFYIIKDGDNKGFTIHATGYNPSRAYETLTFRVGDPGNDVYVNSIEITIRVYTIYSDMENPTVGKLSKDAYENAKNGYLAGANVVKVKPYDEYLGIGAYANNAQYKDSAGKPSVYNYIYFGGDSQNTEGTAESPIVDRDVRVAGTQSYAAYVYAFMSNNQPLSASEIDKLLVRNGNTFSIKQGADVSQYLIGGINVNGNSITPVASALANVNKYFNFTVAGDGASISFIPKTATIDKKIMLFINVQKRVGTREAARVGQAVSAGTLFSLEVEDSAPRGVKLGGQSYSREFIGARGDSVTYRIFGGERGDALFEDSDLDDAVSINIENNVNNNWYKDSALALALQQDSSLDWGVNAAMGKERAITVSVDGDYVTITINRRMDKKLADGSYAKEVTFPLVLTGIDKAGKQDSAIIMVTVCNTAMTAVDGFESFDTQTGVGYTFARDLESRFANEYIMRANVLKGADLTVSFADILVDADYKVGANTDSYKFAPQGTSDHTSSFEYLVDENPKYAIYYTDVILGRNENLAKVTPNYTKVGDEFNYSGITINAEASVRNRTGSLRMYIVDRSADATNEGEGVYITLEITVINAKPEVIDGRDGYTIDILGSDVETVGHDFYLKDFVFDSNESDIADMKNAPIGQENTRTWLRIYTVTYMYYSEINATDKAKVPDQGASSNNSSLMFTVSYSGADSEDYGQKFNIRPNVGFYGSGAFEITVADGNINEYPDTEFETFRINVNVIYNPSDIKQMQIDPMARGKKRVITIKDLVNDITNVFSETTGLEDEGNDKKFNPASWYVLESVTPATDSGEYIRAIKNAEGEFEITALAVTAPGTRRVNIEYALKSDKENSPDSYTKYTSYFDIRINENKQPKLTYSKMTFERYADEDKIDPMFKLNTSNTASLYVEQLFVDPEDDVMRFVSVKSNKASLVSAKLSEDKDRLIVKFNASGDAELSVTVTDESGANYTYMISVNNSDLPEPDLWTRFLASLESNKVMWVVIFASILLAIIILIIIIAVVKKRKRAREELEALLVSEMEIEEQMLRLTGGPSPTDYQSYGYLPPTPGPSVDPNLMLGAGMNVPTEQHLGLAAPTQQQPTAPDMNGEPPESTNPFDGL